jgi:flavin-binding protein dodecin
MNEHVYKTIELTGSSTEGMQQAINNAIQRAGKTVHHMRWLQVTLKVSFNVE